MKIRNVQEDLPERLFRDARLFQPVALPAEEWFHSVMRGVRQEPRPVRPVAPLLESVAWRTGWVAAVAASILVLLSLSATPALDRMAWDLYKGGAMAQLSVRMGE